MSAPDCKLKVRLRRAARAESSSRCSNLSMKQEELWGQATSTHTHSQTPTKSPTPPKKKKEKRKRFRETQDSCARETDATTPQTTPVALHTFSQA
jgi:hypothetical protein